MQRARQSQQQQQQPAQQYQQPQQQMIPAEQGRTGAIRESRIKDRPVPQETRDSSLKIKIELDLEVEVSNPYPSYTSPYPLQIVMVFVPNRWICTLASRETSPSG